MRTFLQIMGQVRALCLQGVPRSQEDVGEIDATIAELDKLCDSLMKTPAVDPKYGPQQSKARHDRFTRELRVRLQ
ncbi:MAG: hypothetical protein COZ06_36380 [Armatimonadetes bacterium CG_4_10_14_3_um_filter_66_18]|nr:MAG: hypothetical protein COZ06_36380 [Armatimonadetes bacterium CG_4_10_14_3_um_filter_66_18]